DRDPARVPVARWHPDRNRAVIARHRWRACAFAATVTLSSGCASGPPPGNTVPLSPSLATRLAPAVQLLDSMIAAGTAPGAVLAVSVNGERFIHGTGRLGLDDARVPDHATLYDMASLT